jgi:hypothetical protein
MLTSRRLSAAFLFGQFLFLSAVNVIDVPRNVQPLELLGDLGAVQPRLR